MPTILDQWFRDRKIFTVILVVTALLGTAWIFLTRLPLDGQASEIQPSPREGFSAPDFSLETLTGGEEIRLSSLAGKVVLVNFWASWCPPCRAEMPAIEKVYKLYNQQGFIVLGVNTTNQDSLADAQRFVEEVGVTFPILLDRSGSASQAYALAGLPSSYFIDRQGIIRSVIVGGPMSEALIRSEVEKLLKENP